MQYKEQQDVLNYEKINEILDTMPDFTRYIVEEYKANKASSRTILGYIRDIDTFMYFLENQKKISRENITLQTIESITPLDLTAYKSFLGFYKKNGIVRKNGVKASNRKLIALRQFYQFLFRMDLIKDDPTKKLTLINDKNERDEHEITTLSHEQISDVLHTVETGNGLTENQKKYNKDNELRDIAIMEIFLNTGMRVSELVGLNLQDVSLDEDVLFIVRKGHTKAQRIHFNQRVHDALSYYLAEGRKESEKDPDALFISRKGQRITVRSVERLVSKYSQAAGAGHSTAHKLRRSYGTELYSATSDIFAVSERLGHKNIETAKKHYVRPSEERDIEIGKIEL